MSTNNGDANALPDARAAAEEARLLAAAWSELRSLARDLHARARLIVPHLPPDNMHTNMLSDGARAAGYAARLMRGLDRAAAELDRLAELQHLERAAKALGG